MVAPFLATRGTTVGCPPDQRLVLLGRLTKLAALPQLGSDGVPVCMAAMQVSEGGQGGRGGEGRREPPGLMMLVKKLQLRGETLGGEDRGFIRGAKLRPKGAWLSPSPDCLSFRVECVA